MLLPLRKIKLPISNHPYSFSNYSSGDFLEDYHGPYEVPVKVLVLSCGDLPFAVPSTALCSPQKIESITFTDESSVVIARNVLMAKIIIDAAFDPSKEDDIHYLWDIWYNMEWSSKTLQRFLKDVSELDKVGVSQFLHIPAAHDKEVLQRIWKFWFFSASEMNSLAAEKLHEQRYESIINHIQGIVYPRNPKPKCSIKSTLAEIWEWMVVQTKDHMDVSHLPEYHHKAISEEMRMYFETGNCCKKKETIVCINPMFLNPETGQWALVSSVSPFEAYLNLKMLPTQNTFLSSCQSVLGNQVTSLRKRLLETSFYFHVGGALELCYRGIWGHNFDIVDCSNLPDQLGLANILNAAQLALNDNSYAILLTESAPWRDTTSSIRHYSAKEFIEESLCTSIEMIPSLYGLMLINHVHLGNPLPLLRSWRPSVRLQWRKSPCFTNMHIELSGAIGQFIEDLQLRCFGGSNNQSADILESFSPLTYCYLVASFTSRVELSEISLQSLDQPSLSTFQELAWKTFQAWMNGHKVLHVQISLAILNPYSKEEGPLRLIFANSNDTAAHHFENFELSRDECNLVVSFLLLDDHHLELKSTVVYLESSVTSTPVTSSCLLTDASSTLAFPIPFVRKMKSDAFLKCLEFEEFYHIDLPGIRQEEMTLSTDREPPSEAGHQITLSTGTTSQTLTFPWPLKVADVHSTCELETGTVRLVLPKSINEPRPYEWKDRKQWDINSLNSWDPETLLKDLCFHLCAQFEVLDLKRQVLNKTTSEGGASGLNGVREIVRMIIQTSVSDNNLLYVIQSKHDPSLKNLWFLRVHLPVRISPLGSPILFLTANDHRLAKKFVDRGALEQTQATEDFKRIFVEGETGSGVLPLFIYSEEEENLLRYLLRLNSTKIITNTWPIKQVPTGENSPWLKTFVSPCYVDQVGTDAEMEDLVATTKKVNIEDQEGNKNQLTNDLKPDANETCSKCKQPKGNLKRCSRCRSVKYCSVECQRSDWTVHKLSCL